MNILVTGANGFVGRNLCSHLKLMENVNLYEFDKENTTEELKTMVMDSQFIMHFAGVNRPKDETEFFEGNTDLTKLIIETLESNNLSVPILLSSSTQATRDNAYGKSKLMAEKAVIDYGIDNDVPVYVYRFPNLFGKWCRPNYNSVVATFCHNIANDLPITINAPDALITLSYIDDVVNECLNAMVDDVEKDGNYCVVREKYDITLQDLADMIYSFRDVRKTGIIPDMTNSLTKYMYSTYLSYVDDANHGYKPELHTDDRGWLFELIKSPNIGQIFVSKTKPGITRGNHYHHTKVEKFTVIEGKALIRLRCIDGDEVLDYEVNGDDPTIVNIPPGYTHNISNIGDTDVLTLFWVNEIFNKDKPDTIYEEV